MGLLDNVTGGDGRDVDADDDLDARIDHYKIMFREFDGNYSEAEFCEEAIDNATAMSEPIDEDAFARTAENMDWRKGEYKCQARNTDGTFGATQWVVKVGSPEEVAEEQDEIDQLRQSVEMLAAEVAEGGVSISDPDEARGAVFERLLEGDLDPDTAGSLRDFLSEWEQQSRDPVSDPGEFAAKLANAHLASGNNQMATAILDRWMQSETQAQADGDGSLVSLAQNIDSDEMDMETIKTLGALRFLDDPRGMIHDAAGGLMDAAEEAPAADAQADGQAAGSPIADALSTGGQQQAQSGAQTAASETGGTQGAQPPADTGGDESTESGDESADEAPRSAADLSVPGMDEPEADPMSAAPEDVDDQGETGDPVTHSEVEAGPEVAEAVEGDNRGNVDGDGEYGASCPYCGKTFYKDSQDAAEAAVRGHKGNCAEKSELDREESALEDEIDREADEYPNAADAMDRLNDAADDETEGEA